MYFQYGEAETAYLSARDERMAAVIAQVGHIEREVDTDLFSAVVHHIVGQQISTKAQATIWKRMRDEFGVVDAAAVLGAGVEKLQSFGMTFRKAEYITDFARKIESGEFDLEGIRQRPDDEAIRELSGLKGVGVWTAEMILLFCMQRPNVFSYDDLAIQRGLRMVYHHRPETVRKVPPPVQSLLQRGQPLPLGGSRRRGAGPQGLRADPKAEKEGMNRHDLYDALRFAAGKDTAGSRRRRDDRSMVRGTEVFCGEASSRE